MPCSVLGQGPRSLGFLLWKVGTGPALRFPGAALRPPTGVAAPGSALTPPADPHLATLPPNETRSLTEEVLLPPEVQGAALDLGDLDALGWQWATSLAALAEAEALLLVRAGLTHGA